LAIRELLGALGPADVCGHLRDAEELLEERQVSFAPGF
jgi:hypothetical protein